MPRQVVGTMADFPDKHGVSVFVGKRRIAVFRSGGRWFAVDDRCPHRGFPLHDGLVRGESVLCRSHGSCFNLSTGAVERGPAGRGINSYTVFVTGERVEIEVPDE